MRVRRNRNNTAPSDVPKVVAAVRAAAAWFGKTAIHGKSYVRRELIDSADAKPIWARYYEIGTGRPIFGDRDKSIHDTVSEISEERRRGYGWYNEVPQMALDRYAKWALIHR